MLSRIRYLLLGAICFLLAVPQSTFGQVTSELPKAEYYVAKDLFGAGRTVEAGQGFTAALNRARQVGEARWIDSIPPLVMLGECHYRRGALGAALEQYDAAIMLALSNPTWIDQIESPPEQLPLLEGAPKGITWFAKSRATQPVAIPDGLQIAIDPTRAQVDPQTGGVVAPVSLVTRLDTTEVLRTLGVAMLRRWQILGPLAKHSPLTAPAIDMFSRPPAQPLPWLHSSWTALKGMSRLSNGRPADALPSIRDGLLIGDQFDYFMTPLALIALAEEAAQSGNYQAAATSLQDASLLAAQYEQHLELAWSLKLLGSCAAAGTRTDLLEAFQQAANWAQKRSASTYATCCLGAAELAIYADNFALAEKLTQQASLPMRAREVALPRLQAQLHFVNALAGFARDRSAVGAGQFELALKWMQGNAESGAVVESVFQAQLVLNLLADGNLTAAQAEDLLSQVLAEPSAYEWEIRPLATIASMTTLRLPAFERHLELAFAQADEVNILERMDRLQREQFYEALPLGGRWLAWREVLAMDPNGLDQSEKTARGRALQRSPELQTHFERIQELVAKLKAGPAPLDARQLSADLRKAHDELTNLSQSYENMVAFQSLIRQPLARVAPPKFDIASMQQKLADDDLLVAFAYAGGSLVGVAITKQSIEMWPVLDAATVGEPLGKLMAELRLNQGNGRRVTDVSAPDAEWRATVVALRDELFPDAIQVRVDAANRVILVPHRQLWYLPFELLPTKDGSPMISSKRICYAPTLGMVDSVFGTQGDLKKTVGITGNFFSQDSDENRRLSASIASGATNSSLIALDQKITVPSSQWLKIYSDQYWLAAGVELGGNGVWDRTFMPLGNAKASNFGDLLQTPQSSPSSVVMAGLETQIGEAGKGNGDEIFLPATALLLSGTKSAVLTRWTVGGRSTPTLLRRYLEENSRLSSSAALRRATLAMWPEEFLVEYEPKLLPAPKRSDPLTLGIHPLLWAGYLVVGDAE